MARIVEIQTEKKTPYNRPDTNDSNAAHNSKNSNTQNDINAFFDPTQEVMELAAEDQIPFLLK